MATFKISIQYVGTANYLIAVAAKTVSPNVEAERKVLAPPYTSNNNFAFTNLQPTPHYIDVYSSTDGTTLGFKVSNTFIADVKNQSISSERLFYTVDGGRPVDPLPNQDMLLDDYLDGKSIVGVYKQGDRYLMPDIDYELVAGGGIRLLNGALFSEGESMTIELSYTVTKPSTYTPPGSAGGFATVPTSITLDDSYDNYTISANASGARITLTLRDISSIPDMTTYHFLNCQGSQLFVKIVTSNGNSILFDGSPVTQISIGRMEFVKILKSGTNFYITESHAGLTMVGENVDLAKKDTRNTLKWDDATKIGDDYPRFFEWLKNDLEAGSKVTSTDSAIESYSRPAGKEALFIISETRFRMPNGQGWSKRGLANMNNFGADGTRTYDYPLGTQPGKVGSHFHASGTQVNKDATGGEANSAFNRAANHNVRTWNVSNTINANQTASTDLNEPDGTENITKNIGVIFASRT